MQLQVKIGILINRRFITAKRFPSLNVLLNHFHVNYQVFALDKVIFSLVVFLAKKVKPG